ncbi:DUF1672 family protein [Staphylococcus simulans]
MNKLVTVIFTFSFLLGGCSFSSQQVPRTMPVNEYKGQGFQPKAEKDAIELAEKHKKEFADLGERFFKDNFGLNVKATNVVGSGKGAEVFVHCDDHDIVFNSSIVVSADSLGYKGSARAQEESDELATQIGKVVSGFDYKANKKEYDELYQYFKDNQKNYGYYGYTKEAINKTQNSGYQNEFFRLSGRPMTLKEYNEHLRPLITLSNPEFKRQYISKKELIIETKKSYLVTNLFDRFKHYNKERGKENLLKISDDIIHEQIGPQKSEISYTLLYTEKNINIVEGRKNDADSIRFGVYDSE